MVLAKQNKLKKKKNFFFSINKYIYRFSTSAKENTNIGVAMDLLVRSIFTDTNPQQLKPQIKKTIDVTVDFLFIYFSFYFYFYFHLYLYLFIYYFHKII